MNTGLGSRPTISDLLMVTLGPLVGYFAAFTYHREYAVAFGIPPDLISINPSSLLVAAYGIWNFIVLIGLFIAAVYLVGGPVQNPIDARLRRAAILINFLIPLWILYENLASRIVVLIAVAVILHNEFLRPLWKFREVGGYVQKLQLADQEEGVLAKVSAQFPVPFRLLVLTFTVVYLSSAAGRNKALHTDRFLVLADRPDFIVPAISSDNLVAVRIDRRMKKILPEIVVITREPGKPLVLRWEEIGRLTPVGD